MLLVETVRGWKTCNWFWGFTKSRDHFFRWVVNVTMNDIACRQRGHLSSAIVYPRTRQVLWPSLTILHKVRFCRHATTVPPQDKLLLSTSCHHGNPIHWLDFSCFIFKDLNNGFLDVNRKSWQMIQWFKNIISNLNMYSSLFCIQKTLDLIQRNNFLDIQSKKILKWFKSFGMIILIKY